MTDSDALAGLGKIRVMKNQHLPPNTIVVSEDLYEVISAGFDGARIEKPAPKEPSHER